MDLIEESFKKLFPDKEFNFSAALEYNGRLKAYGANIRMGYGRIALTLSKKWRGVSREIQMGLIQELMIKLFKPKVE